MSVTVENRQEALAVGADLIRRLAETGRAAMELIVARQLGLTEGPRNVHAYLVDDVAIAELHGQYMDDPTATDVLTFPYGESGEILLSVETARLQAAEYGQPWERELALYLVHGLLHLFGHEDGDESGRRRMDALQAELLEEVFDRSGEGI